MNRTVAWVVVAATVLAHACDRVVDLTSAHDAMIGGDGFSTDTGLAVPDSELAIDARLGGSPDAATVLDAGAGGSPDAGVGGFPDAAASLDAATASELHPSASTERADLRPSVPM